jgi:hypothetical protein
MTLADFPGERGRDAQLPKDAVLLQKPFTPGSLISL